jgi:hypothetical protein
VRTYGRIPVSPGAVDSSATAPLAWVEIDTDSAGYNDDVYLTTLCQVLLLNLNESPFYATYGIPALQSVLQQTFPDYNVALTQQTFAPYFASITIQRVAGQLNPTYQVNVVTHQGAVLTAQVAT